MKKQQFARLEIQLETDLKQKLREKAKEEGVLMSRFIRNLIIKNLNQAA